MNEVRRGSLIALAVLAATSGMAWADWTPNGPIKMLIGATAGGGTDTLSRLMAEDIEARYGWTIIPENVTGEFGGALLRELKSEPADGLTWGTYVTDGISYGMQIARDQETTLDDFTYLSTMTGTQMALVAKASRGWRTLGDAIDAAKAGETLSVGAMTDFYADGTYVIGKRNNVVFNSVAVQGGKGGLNGVVADDLDLAWVGGAQTAGVQSGDLVNLVSAEDKPLGASPDAPMLSEFNVPYVFGTRFFAFAPANLPADVREAIEDAITTVVNDPESKINVLSRKAFSGPDVISGADLEALLRQQTEDFAALIKEASE